MKLKKWYNVFLTTLLLMGCSGVLWDKSDQSSTRAAVQTRLQLGMEYLARGDLNAARRNFEKALNTDPRDYRVQLAMALYEQKIGENRAAEQRYHHALKLAPENGTVLNNYGVFLCNVGQYAAAQQQFSAVALRADYGQVADSLENAGYCFLKANQDSEARVLLSRALRFDPEKGAALLAEAERKFEQGKRAQVQLLLEVYQYTLPVSAASLWLQIRFAALTNRQDILQRYGRQLAQYFPQSKQYQYFLAHEY